MWVETDGIQLRAFLLTKTNALFHNNRAFVELLLTELGTMGGKRQVIKLNL